MEFSLENKLALEAKQRRLERSGKDQNHDRQKLRAVTQLAPRPLDADGKKVKQPKGLPSHWGPKVRHNRPAPLRVPNKPKGKMSRKQAMKSQKIVTRVENKAPKIKEMKVMRESPQYN